MARSEAQKAADKRYRETHKGQLVTFATKLPPAECAEIDELIKSQGMNKAEFIRWAAMQLRQTSK